MSAILTFALVFLSVGLPGSGLRHHALAAEYPALNRGMGSAASPGNASSVTTCFDSIAVERAGERSLPNSLFLGDPVHVHHHVDVPEPLLFDLVRPLEEYKLGLQWTIGTAFENHYIHSFQVLIQPTSEWENWNSTLLYPGGIRFDEDGSGNEFCLQGDGTSEFILVPQVHYQFTDNFQVQSGLGLGVFSEGSEQSFILRVVYSN